MEIFTKIFLLCNKNHWGSILFAQIIQENKVFQKVHLWQETMSTSDKWNIFNISVQNNFPKLRDIFQRRIKNVIRPSSPRPDDRSKLSVGLGLPLKNYPNFIKLGFSWNVSSFQSPLWPQWPASQPVSWRQTLHNTKFWNYHEIWWN